jgi:RNA polymerase-binding transcription factor DksA
MTREQLIRNHLVRLVDEVLARYEKSFLPRSSEYRPTKDAYDVIAARDSIPALTPADSYTLEDLVRAFLRVDAGTYGSCHACGTAIGYQRLLEHPTTQLCESCDNDEGWRPSHLPG